MVSTNQIIVGSAAALSFGIVTGAILKRSPLLNAMTPRQLATTALVIGTVDAMSASGVMVGVVLKALGCNDVADLEANVKRWRRPSVHE